MENKNITILWLDDQREPYSYFKKKKTDSGAWVRNNDFYQENIFNNFKPNFIWVKNLPEFSGYIIKNGLPDLVSFDHDLSSKTVRCDHNGADCARWLVNYCKENGLKMPKCFAHTANNKQRPVLNDILGLNENNKPVMKINETQLRKIIKESIVKILKESDFDNESGYGDYGDNKLLYRGNGYEIIVNKDNTELYIQFEDSFLAYDEDGEWFDSVRGEVIEVPKEDFEYFGGEGVRLDKKAVSIITRFVSQLTPGSKYANPEFYI